MKRIGNLYQQIISLDNIVAAEKKARKGKTNTKPVIKFDKNREELLLKLKANLEDGEFKNSKYTTFTVFDPKERLISALAYYPDRIVQHSIMNVLEPIFDKNFTADTYSCIKGRGVHKGASKLKKVLKADPEGTKYCLKLDIKKFYPSIDNDLLKDMLRRKFKDKMLLSLLDEIINSSKGLPIGNFLSQSLGNFYLSGFDHWIKEVKRVRYYFKYCDDIVVLADNKADLHQLLADIKAYMKDLKLEVKQNYQIFPVEARGIDFLGYKFYHSHTLLRKRIKISMKKAVRKRKVASIPSYMGWAKHCDSKNLVKSVGL